MPIEIKELHIRVAVTGAAAKSAPAAAAASSKGDAEQKDALVAECVEQVLQILQDKKER